MIPPGSPWVPLTNVSPFGPAVWPAIANIYITNKYTHILCRKLYYKDRMNDPGSFLSIDISSVCGL